MAENVEIKEALPDLDDLLQCPVCYEIPTGQIFQCNEGHHVCGRCKMRLDMCPVCRALFFGTRNYAMEELIANVKKLRAFKLGGKVTTGALEIAESSTPSNNSTIEPETEVAQVEAENSEPASQTAVRAPQACKGLFRCLCCKNSYVERLPAARLLNHLRYYHAGELLEGQSVNGEYVQAWQFSTNPGRLVTALRISDMGIFFLIIEISTNSVCAWAAMAASPWVAHEFSYTVTISGNDREAIFSDCVWSVRSCEGSLKKRGHCLVVNGLDARALIEPVALSGKLAVRRTPPEQLANMPQPRAVLRVASRGNEPARAPTRPLVRAPARPPARPPAREPVRAQVSHDLEPFLQDLQNDVARLSRAFATLGREADALVRSEAQMRARIENSSRNYPVINERVVTPPPDAPPPVASPPVAPPPVEPAPTVPDNQPGNNQRQLSRNARRRIRQRLRAALDAPPQPPSERPAPAQRPNGVIPPPMQNGHTDNPAHLIGLLMNQPPVPPPVLPPPVLPQPSSGPSDGHSQNGNQARTNRNKRHQRR